ncbi:MAG TPA: helix-turn-helix domain-containing protein [Desulfuromonadaceae bacterium]
MLETAKENSDSSTNSPGAILKRCREYHNLSLEEAAEETKVGTNYLKALEDDQVKVFASLAYLKGFLRIYANYLGLNPDDVMRIYEKMYNPPDPQENNPLDSARKSKRTIWRFSWQKLALPAFLLLLLIITSSFLNRSKSPLPPPPQTAAKPPVTQPVAAVMPGRSSVKEITQKPEAVVTKRFDEDRQEKPLPERKVVQKPPAEPPKGFIMRLKTTQNGAVAVTIDGAAPQNYDLTVGDSIEWKADKSIVLDLSNAGGVEAEINGKPLGPLGSAGKPAYVQLGADGVK